MYDILMAILLGIVEGITEFLPISSTGHLILVGSLFGHPGVFGNEQFAFAFDVIIQLGAIFSVILYFWHKLWPFSAAKSDQQRQSTYSIWLKAIIGVIPALGIGFFAHDYIEAHFTNPITVSIALIFWGIVLIWLERRQKEATINDIADLSIKVVLVIGLIQCIAMIPGTSRSAATIIGAMLLGTSRVVAAEFSFFLAIPTMAAASGYAFLKLLKSGVTMGGFEYLVLGVGFIVSFLVAYAVIAFLMRYITRHDFQSFGYYRIALGFLVLLYFGLSAQ
ncbi:MAG: undecaprenyl-diphosphate phosphatase [Bacteroidetes Order II. Incertae sedis bacterium]|nr:undecaprenyl-diphosphate phosphatase [Bacteroidetes Order II. bacterium]